MEIDYQRKYFQLKNQCHKHEATIAKLQAQIRQRCQSYLLYSSRNKKANTAEGLDTSQVKELQKSSSIKEPLDESIVKKYEHNKEEGQKGESKVNGDEASEAAQSGQDINPKQEHLAISAQVSLVSEGANLPKIKEEGIPDSKEMIIQSYKDRIAKINEQKTKYAKQAEKKSGQLLQANMTITDLERKLEATSKSEKKLKNKLNKMAQFQEKIHKIYEEIYQNLNIKDKAIGREQIDSFTQRIEFILQLIAESAEGLEKSHKYSSTSNEDQETISNGHSCSQARKEERSSLEHSQNNFNQQGFNNLTMTKSNKIYEDVSTPVSVFEDQQANEAIKQINSNLQQQHNNIEQLIDQMNKEHEKQIQLLKEQFEKERINLKNIFQKEVEAHQSYQAKCKALEKDLKEKDSSVSQLNQELAEARGQLKQSQAKIEQYAQEISKYKQELSQSRALEAEYQKAKEELDKSRSIIDDLEHSKLKKEYSQLKDFSLQSTKDKKKDDLANSSLKIVENLEEPYYVEEDLYSDPNDQYVKRSFIRKKIVRRNFSATAYRVISKSKEEVDAIVHNNLHNYTDKSLQKKEKLKETLKYEKQSRKAHDPNPRISELSEQNRESDYMQQEREVVKVFEVETKTPKEIITTKKISCSNGEESISLKRKLK